MDHTFPSSDHPSNKFRDLRPLLPTQSDAPGFPELLMFLKVKKFVGLTAGLLLVAAWFGYANLENSFLGNPRVPVPETGMILPHVVKGVTVFISEVEQRLLLLLKYVGVISAIIAGLVLLIHGGDPFRPKDRS